MSLSDVDKEPLLLDDESEAPELPQLALRWTKSPSRAHLWLLVSAVTNILLLAVVAYQRSGLSASFPWKGSKPLYSPVNDVITYEDRVFTHLTGTTKYHGPPSPEVDQAWKSLYRNGITAISTEEASKLVNRTLPWPGYDDEYIVSLDVVHILHCLDHIRKSFWPEYYGDHGMRYMNLTDTLTGQMVLFDHSDHCVNMIRESLMCNVDITPNVWKWSKFKGRAEPRFDTVHTCRKWEPIHDWMDAHHPMRRFNNTIHILDGLKFPDDGLDPATDD